MKDDVNDGVPNETPKLKFFLWGGKLKWGVEVRQ
jgi:hypothetical protein